MVAHKWSRTWLNGGQWLVVAVRVPHPRRALAPPGPRRGGSNDSRSGDTGEYFPLFGKQRLDPVDDRAHAGGAAQVTMNDDPVFGGNFGDRRCQPFEQGMAVADIAGQYPAAGAGAD